MSSRREEKLESCTIASNGVVGGACIKLYQVHLPSLGGMSRKTAGSYRTAHHGKLFGIVSGNGYKAVLAVVLGGILTASHPIRVGRYSPETLINLISKLCGTVNVTHAHGTLRAQTMLPVTDAAADTARVLSWQLTQVGPDSPATACCFPRMIVGSLLRHRLA